jgi:hypothetical protein
MLENEITTHLWSSIDDCVLTNILKLFFYGGVAA